MDRFFVKGRGILMINYHFKKLAEIRQALNANFFERENEVEGMLIALLARQHMLLIGPAGTAKSALSVELAKIVQGTTYFQWLLTKFSTPEELFGPLSLKDLEKGVYKRVTAAKMPEAHLVFLDEIFKANAAILNSILTLINERIFYNDGLPSETPLISVIGASNEYPDEDEELGALFDRFLLRYEVDFIADDKNFIAMMQGTDQVEKMPSITLGQLEQLQRLTDDVIIPDEVYDVLSEIRIELRDEGIRPSDRRFQQSLSVLQARAFIHERKVVQVEDVAILKHVLWETIDQKETVCSIIQNYAHDGVTQKLFVIQNEASEVFYTVSHDPSPELGMEATQKMNALVADLKTLKSYNKSREKDIDALLNKVTAMQHEMLNRMLEPWYFDVPNHESESASVFFKM